MHIQDRLDAGRRRGNRRRSSAKRCRAAMGVVERRNRDEVTPALTYSRVWRAEPNKSSPDLLTKACATVRLRYASALSACGYRPSTSNHSLGTAGVRPSPGCSTGTANVCRSCVCLRSPRNSGRDHSWGIAARLGGRGRRSGQSATWWTIGSRSRACSRVRLNVVSRSAIAALPFPCSVANVRLGLPN